MKDYFCLADGRTAALINPAGGCDFWCWPGFDSAARLAALLDPGRGGSVGVTAEQGVDASASWAEMSRVVRFSYLDGLQIQCGLLDDGSGASALAWLVDGPPGATIRITLRDPSAGGGAGWARGPFGATLAEGVVEDGPGGPLLLTSSASTEVAEDGLIAYLPEGGLAVWLGAPGELDQRPPLLTLAEESPADAVRATRELLAGSVAADREWILQLHATPPLAELAARAPRWAIGAVDRSLLTLRGLQHRDSGLFVAAPVTSIPQWPASVRAWDYRYAWLRDCADAGMALCRVGALPEAEAVARGLGRLVGERPDRAAPVRRVLGGELPQEHVLGYLRGYSGAVVRIGNGAAGQVQLDTLGEMARLASELDRHQHHCPEELLRHVPAIAAAAARTWRLPDHGIWEARGKTQDYVHSKVMAWSALEAACSLADRGQIEGAVDAWRKEQTAIESELLHRGRGPNRELVMSFQDSGADSALLAAYLVGFVVADQPDADATLRRVALDLGRGPLMARHSPERDGIAAPCFPFIFPALWAAWAEALLGELEAAESRVRAVYQLAGAAGQLSEVADPETGELWGNYPQVQSHAALVDAVLAIWAAPLRPLY